MAPELRICYLTFDSLSEGVGQSQILPLIKGLADKNYKVTLITFEKNQDVDLLAQLSELNIKWISLPFGTHGIKGVPLRLLRMTKNIPKADIYHCRSDLPVAALALKGRRPFLWDVRSLWYEQKLIVDGRAPSGIVYKIARLLERFAAVNAAAVNVLASPLLSELENRNDCVLEVTSAIPTCVDLEKFSLNTSLPKVKKILLSGTLNNFYDMATTINVVRAFQKNGFRVEWARGRESNRTEKLDDFVEIIELEHSQMPTIISNASYGIAICRTDCPQVLKGVMPTKIAEFLAVGRPVIISQGMGDLDELISKSRTGLIVREDMKWNDLVYSAIELLEDKDISYRCRKLAEEHFSMSRAIKKYEVIYKKIHENSIR